MFLSKDFPRSAEEGPPPPPTYEEFVNYSGPSIFQNPREPKRVLMWKEAELRAEKLEYWYPGRFTPEEALQIGFHSTIYDTAITTMVVNERSFKDCNKLREYASDCSNKYQNPRQVCYWGGEGYFGVSWMNPTSCISVWG
eukprot:TRINITY_DN5092_c0_g1_i1.p1 TRINITY_DN5092_c0_g1~~TRINITY_DN5092_c0_g1_i1.p1  ORF type:complete len:140 (-),score=16.05 TRINITY_DN5092_c0_g1_i1:512-931(-)